MMKSVMAIALFALALAALPIVSAQADKNVSAVYFTGIGCPHCAKADPVVLNDLLIEYPNLIIVEYEIYQDQSNAPLIFSYNEIYESGIGIPLLIFANGQSIVGDIPIMNDARNVLGAIGSMGCPLPDGTSADIRFLDMSKMPGNPKFWTKDRVVIPGPGTDAGILRDLLLEENLTKVLASGDFRLDHDDMVPLSGGQIKFQHAATIGQSSIKWNGECPDLPLPDDGTCDNESAFGYDSPRSLEDLTVLKILFLAAVDAVNPCALAVLTLMLIAILTYNPKARRKILLAGMAFTLSVFIMYIVYGLVIIRFFQLIQAITSIRLVLYRLLGIAAMALGILNLKDFFRYKPGGMMTEMPMRLRPKLKKVISGITSPKGAFLVGAFVTVFLLPCTIGPYVIAGGILSTLEILQTIPWLILYNLVFVIPMVAITLLVYFGTKRVEDVSGWKDRNIRYLHLVSGSIILLLGLSMLLGLL